MATNSPSPRRARLRRRLVCLVLLVATLPGIGVLTAAAPAGAATVPAVGLYSGAAYPSGVSDHDAFAAWLSSPVPFAVEFLETYGSWDEVANPSWALDRWSPWVQAQPGRRLVLSVPLLVSSASGQLAQGAAGSFDSTFRTLAQNMVARQLGTSVIRLGWEMNNSGFPWWAGKDPAAFRSFYARIVTVMRSVPGAAFSFDWNPNLGVQGGSPLTTFESFYPGDAYVDVIGLDAYDIKWMDTTSTAEQRWSWMRSQQLGLDQHRAFAAAHGKPVSFPEWGLYARGDQLGGGGDNPFFIDAMADWFTSSNALYQAYFDYDFGGGTLGSFPNGEARYKTRFGGTGTTAAAQLSISNVVVSSITSSSAVITWTTNLPATSTVGYGTSVPNSTATGASGVTSHRVTLTNLTARTRYAFTTQSRTDSGLTAASPIAYLTTKRR